MWVFVFMFAFAPGFTLVLGPLAGPVVAGRRLRVWWKRLRRMDGWVVAMVVCGKIQMRGCEEKRLSRFFGCVGSELRSGEEMEYALREVNGRT